MMKDIRKEIKEKGYKASELSFYDVPMIEGNGVDVDEEFSFSEYEKEFLSMKARWAIPTEVQMTSSNPIVQLIKKVVRKMSRCVIFPLVSLQDEFNCSVVRTNGQIRNYIEKSEKEKKELKKRIEELEKIIEEIKRKGLA